MADVRSVVVRLSADTTGYIASMQRAGVATDSAMGKSEKAAHRASVGLTDVEKAGAAAAVMLAGKAVLASADFDQAMSNVEAATHGTAAEMASLEQAALDAGKATKFSATEAAAGIENLAKAGIGTADILDGGLTGALDLAAAGELAVADAAEIAATALTQFKLEGEDIPHVADLLAAGAGKAQGEVTDLAMALKQGGLVAAQMGFSIEETTGVLSSFAAAGLLGSDAGTSLKTMLLRLANPSNEAADAMERFGINAYDANGNMVSAADLAGQLETAFDGQSQATRDAAMATIFGSDAIRAANVLYNEGASGISDWTAKVDDAGYAAETAGIKMDNLKGDVEVLMGSIETALIGSGDSSQDSLRSTTQLLTELVDGMSELNEQSVIGDTIDQLSVVNSDVFQIGLDNLKKTKDAIFGVDDASKEAADSAGDTGDALEGAAAASQTLTQHAAKTAEQLEAEAEALEDARKAATDTAGEFFNLGDSLDDASVSLGQWITDMAKQSAALENFTSNAKKAAKNGLRDGLIAALEDMGPAGALRMQQLANATDAEIDRANKAWARGQRAIDAYVDTVVPEKILRVDPAPAITAMQAVRREIQSLDGTSASVYIRTVRTNSGKGPLGFDASTSADGGSVPKTGLPYADRHLYLLADGEEIISNRYGQADRFRADTAAGRIPGYAGGGTTGKDSGKEAARRREEARQRAEERRLRQLDKQRTRDLLASDLADDAAQAALDVTDAARRLRSAKKADRPRGEILDAKLTLKQERGEQADLRTQIAKDAEDERIRIAEDAAQKQEEIDDAILDGQTRAWDLATDAAQSQVDAAKSMVATVEANMGRLGDAATSAFESTIFDKNSQQHGLWVGANSPGGDWRGNLTGDITGLEERSGLIGRLSDPSLGLSANALEALLGQNSNEGIAAMLAAGEVDDYAALFARREKLLGEVSTQAGMAGYGQEYAAASAELVKSNQKLDLLATIIAAARPITVNEAISAEATVREIARLESLAGGY